jgi:hypothetical protein
VRVFGVTMNLFASLLLAASTVLPPAPFVPWAIDKPAREFLTNFNAGQFEAASKDFNEELRVTSPVPLLKTVKQNLDDQAGAFKEVTETKHTKDSGFKIVVFQCAYEKGSVEVRVTFDPSDHVGAIAVKRIVEQKADVALETMARQLFDDFNAKRFETAGKAFDANMQKQLSPAKLAELRLGVEERYGALISVTKAAQRQEKAYQVIDLTAAYVRAPATFSVYFDGAGRVAGVHIQPVAP